MAGGVGKRKGDLAGQKRFRCRATLDSLAHVDLRHAVGIAGEEHFVGPFQVKGSKSRLRFWRDFCHRTTGLSE
jgi:hypothetical protein